MSNSEDLKLLVASEVEKYPCLWKKQDRSHKNLQRRNNAWENVAKTLNIQVTEAKKIWKSIKDARRYHKQRKISAKSGDAASESEDSVDGT
ncbi:uncharacterized protein LOC125772905 isoform X3 [Anopheles funestus]|uniref:uncharacterized protein LOC128919684 n=1 Tax=Anopheles funestus TaxID=62324 RepID=UPI0020C71D3D|nr:uncharacterized protein LOC128919684 [Anopheles funestus]